MNTGDAKEYLARRDIPQLFESLLTGLMVGRPEDPLVFLQDCLQTTRSLGGAHRLHWDTFVPHDKRALPPLKGSQSRRSFLRNVPPISQFSIESDSDLSETAELIEEYDVFDPSRPRPLIILVIGGPGSGKGTQSLKLAERYSFQYVSVGELLRRKMIHNASCNRKWSLIAKIITTGELAPQETTITEIKQRIMKIPDASGIVIDGFPRDVGQALSFEDQICTPDLVLFLACANHRLKERLEKRAVLQGRPDDNPKATERRLTNFKQNTVPLVTHFQERGLIVTLDADRDEEEVFCDISMTVDNKLFPSREPVAGPSELDLSLLGDISSPPTPPGEQDEVEEDFSYTEEAAEGYCPEQSRPHIIFMMGGPGSGKALQGQQMEDRLGLRRVLLTDLLCHEMQSSTSRGRCIQDALERGDKIPEETLCELLGDAMATLGQQSKGLVVLGFPRDLHHAVHYEAQMGEPTAVLLLDCSCDTMARRLQKQQGATSALLDRLNRFYTDSQSVFAHYEQRGLLHRIDAERSPEEVFIQICQAIDSI